MSLFTTLLLFLVVFMYIFVGVTVAFINYVCSLRIKPSIQESLFLTFFWPYILFKFLI